MKKIFLILLMTFISVAKSQNKEAKLQELIDSYAAINKINGNVLITKNGKILLEKEYGFSDIYNGRINNSNTIFQVGSLTKQFTATIILKLQEQKKLDVSDKINRYLPDYPNGDIISIEHLLTHTSGIFNYTDDRIFMETQAKQPINREIMLKLFQDKPLNFTPGTNFEYSNSNYLVLGYIIEKVTGKSYEKVANEFIFEPLKMNSTGFNFKELSEVNKALGYEVYSKEGSKIAEEFDPTVSYATGGMHTTARDLNKWLIAINSGKVVSKQSYEKAITPFKNNYGYGNYIFKNQNKTIIAHGGLTFGYTSYMAHILEDDVNIIILNNIVNFSINDIAKDIIAILYDQPYKLPEAKTEVVLSQEILINYVGVYEISPQVLVTVSIENNNLYAQATGQNRILLTAQKEDVFYIKGADVQIEFKKNSLNVVIELLLIDGGKVIPAKKIN